jgi:hypothetical protein
MGFGEFRNSLVPGSLSLVGIWVRLFFGDGLGDWVGLIFDEALLSFEDLVAGEGGVAPAFDFDALPFEIFIDGEEMGDLAQHVGIDLGEVPDVFVAGVVLADAEDLLVAEALVEHLEDTDGADLHDAAGEAGGVDEDETVEWVAVVTEGAGDEAVVAGIVDGGVEVAVETEDVELFVVLVLVDTLVGNLDDCVDDLGAVGPYGKFQVVRHKGWGLFSCPIKNLGLAGMVFRIAELASGGPDLD